MNHLVLNYYNFFVKTFYVLQASEAAVERYFNYDGLSELVTILLLFCVTLIVVVTPLFLIFCWIYYSREYVKKYRNKEGSKESIMENGLPSNGIITKSDKIEYSKTYSRMFGFGLSIIAYGISSNVYMFYTFSEFKDALINYFSFPFRIFRSLKILEKIPTNSIPLTEVWSAMLIIVAISAAVFIIGYFIGKIIVAMRLDEEPQVV
ncbi:MAG: hypothetical protein WBN20_00305 [Eudoraea sp.]|uniref:hypothetical protein n=1 Tax=Eudoraea sp. TaxID=1979955 RepID=UPI003C7128C7